MWSGDASTTPDEIAEAVAEAGIDVLCVTDHASINGGLAMRDEMPCRVVVGEEVKTSTGELIGLFLTERVPPGLPADETARRIRDQGGLVYVPHPFDPMRHCLAEASLVALVDDGLIDIIEVFNAKISLGHLNERAAEFAREARLAAGAGSDAHVPEALGAAFVDVPDFDGPAGLLAALAEGRVVGHPSDPARVWRPRIVPSARLT
jgi:predicted metal-dependent phosphoesterase TrpH